MAHPCTGCHSDSGVCASKVPVCTVHLDTVQDCKCGPGFKGEGLACTGGLALAHGLHYSCTTAVLYTTQTLMNVSWETTIALSSARIRMEGSPVPAAVDFSSQSMELVVMVRTKHFSLLWA